MGSTGIVNVYNTRKGIGFIKDDNTELLVFVQESHISDIDKKLKVGDKVTFNIKETDMGPAARIVKRVAI